MSDSNKKRKPQKRSRTTRQDARSAASGNRRKQSGARTTRSSGAKRSGAPSSKKGTARKKPSEGGRSNTKRRPAAKKRAPSRDSRGRGRTDAARGRRPSKGRPGKKKEISRKRKILRISLIVVAVLVVFSIMSAAIVVAAMSRDLPDLAEPLKGRDETSKVYDRDGQLITELFAEENRTRVALADIPIYLRNGVIAIEDQRYYEHQGVDPLGIARALYVDIKTRSTAQGGSTITQQYVVNAFVDREDTITRKIKEAILAYRLEKDYSKDDILAMYLNTIYFGHGAYSVETAAQVYFGKSVTELTIGECAMLAGVIRSPGSYSPYLDPEAAVGRRGVVLGKMLEMGYITEAEHAEATAEELVVAGLDQEATVAPYFLEYVKSLLAAEYGEDALYRGGLEVRTTIDLDMQRAAEAAVEGTLDQEGDPSAALVALDPASGEIRAMVGGRDFATQQYNVAVQGRRQPGSSFKPFVLVTALERGIPSEQAYESGPATLEVNGSADWKVTGAYGGRTGPMRLREATEKSVNSVFAQLIMEVGADRVVETAQRMGITTDIMPVPAIALGGMNEGVSPLEMASAYGTLANGGTHADPQAIMEVKDATGEVLFTSEPVTEEVLDPALAYLATDMLRGVISRGTGTAAQIGRDAAGKTGTTQAYRDAWFCGYTPDLVAAVWVGHPEGQIEMRSVHGRTVTGGSFPAQIWASFMKAALADTPESSFSKPSSGLTSLSICLDTGERVTDYCERTGSGTFLSGALPGDCSLHTGPTYVDLPNLIGKTKEEAIAILNRLGLLFNLKEKDVDGVPAGIVAGQTPSSGQVTTDTVVKVVVSTGNQSSEPPSPAFEFDPPAPGAGVDITFDATTSSDDGAIVSWIWEFGDGAQGSGETVTHAFELAGSYEVTLWVTDDEGQASSVTLTVEVL